MSFSYPRMARHQYGYTLLAMMFFLAIIGAVFVISLGYSQQKNLQLQIDRTTIQMQEILNAGVIFYYNNGKWPTDFTDLSGYISPTNIISPWGNVYTLGTLNENFTVSVELPPGLVNIQLIAQTLTSRLPMGYTCLSSTTCSMVWVQHCCTYFGHNYYTQEQQCVSDPCETPSVCTASGCRVIAQVLPPGQNLSNARSVNFSGIYHSGACVPVPSCPGWDYLNNRCLDNSTDCMKPEIFVAPVSISGVNDAPTPTDCTGPNCNFNVYPLTSYTAYATGPSNITSHTGTGPAYDIWPYWYFGEPGYWSCNYRDDRSCLHIGQMFPNCRYRGYWAPVFGGTPYPTYECEEGVDPRTGDTITITNPTPPGCLNESGTGTPINNPPCFSSTPPSQKISDNSALDSTATTKNNWRVCLAVQTKKGSVSIDTSNTSGITWGAAMGAVLAITRCAPANENVGSEFSVYQ